MRRGPQRVLGVLLIVSAGVALGVEDTPENRAAEAERYMEVSAPQQMLDEVVTQMSAMMPEESRAEFVDVMTRKLDFEAIEKAMVDAMTRIFTADELRALADFHSSPVGQSAQRKMGRYMAAVMPVMRDEVFRAFEETDLNKAAQPDSAEE